MLFRSVDYLVIDLSNAGLRADPAGTEFLARSNRGVLFLKSGEAFVAQLLAVELPELVRLHSLQEAGRDIVPELRATVWTARRAA